MRIVINDEELERHVLTIFKKDPNMVVLVDHFLDRAKEAEVDAICDGHEVHVMGIMEHIEPAGIHSGDSSAVLPTYSLSVETVAKMQEYTEQLAFALKTVGLINVQFAITVDRKSGEEKVYVIEANPRASRTTPFIAKAYKVPYLNIATKVMLGAKKLKDFDINPQPSGFAIKVPVFSFNKFPERGQATRPGNEIHRRGHSVCEGYDGSVLPGTGSQPERVSDAVASGGAPSAGILTRLA